MRFNHRSILAAALLLAVAAPAQAQLGGLRKKLKDKIDATTSKASPATNQGVVYKPADKIAVTAATLDQLVAGLRAERAERDRLMASSTTNADVLAYLRRQDQRFHCDSVKAEVQMEDAALQKQAQDMARTATAEATQNPQAFQQKTKELTDRMRAIHQREGQACDQSRMGPKPSAQQSFFDALKGAQSQQDAVGAKASGLSPLQYAYLRERVVAVMLYEADRARTHYEIPTAYAGYSADEVAAIRSRAAAIRTLVARDFDTNGERAKDTDR